MQTIDNNALVLRVEGDLDARAANKIRSAPRRLRRAMRTEAVVDLRSTRSATSEGWGVLVSAVRSMTWTGSIVTVLMNSGMQALAELSGLARHARVVVFH